jgi:hypothetical protein
MWSINSPIVCPKKKVLNKVSAIVLKGVGL